MKYRFSFIWLVDNIKYLRRCENQAWWEVNWYKRTICRFVLKYKRVSLKAHLAQAWGSNPQVETTTTPTSEYLSWVPGPFHPFSRWRQQPEGADFPGSRLPVWTRFDTGEKGANPSLPWLFPGLWEYQKTSGPAPPFPSCYYSPNHAHQSQGPIKLERRHFLEAVLQLLFSRVEKTFWLCQPTVHTSGGPILPPHTSVLTGLV